MTNWTRWKLSRRELIALGVLGVFYVLFGIVLALNQERVIYQPSAQDFTSCSGFADAQKVVHEDTRMYVEEGARGVVVFYHGNGGSACDRAFIAEEIAAAGYGYIVPEYAGYSNDTEPPSHVRIRENAEDVIAYLREQEYQLMAVMGESVGTGVAAYHTSLMPPPRLLLIAPFTDLADVAHGRFWFYPTSLLVENAYDNVTLLQGYDGEVTIIHGEDDRIISPKLSERLYANLATSEKTYVLIPDVGHNDIFTAPETYDALREFLRAKSE